MSKKKATKRSSFRKIRVSAFRGGQAQFSDSEHLDKYFSEAAQFQLLTRKEEVELWEIQLQAEAVLMLGEL